VVDDQLNFSEYLFNQMATSLSWIGDCFTFFMILDSMLQEEDSYRDCFLSRWRQPWVKLWNGWFRIIFVWTLFLTGSLVFSYLVWYSNDSQFESWRLDYGYTTNEAERAFVGAFIFSLDIAIVTQD